MAFDLDTILSLFQKGSAIVKNVEQEADSLGLLPPQVKLVVDEGTAIVKSATVLAQQIKPTLSATDAATLDAGMQAAHDQAGIDTDRVLAELDAAGRL